MTKYLRPAIVLTIILTIVTGFLYPGVVTGLAQLFFHDKANGSLVYASNGTAIGSELIGQYWTAPRYFHGRPSTTSSVKAILRHCANWRCAARLKRPNRSSNSI